jgi:hypothetical protein
MRIISILFLVLGYGCGSPEDVPDIDAGLALDGGPADATNDATTDANTAADAASMDAGPIAAGDRRFGIEVDEPTGFDHGAELAKAVAIGSSAVQITFPWNALEPTAGQYDLDFLTFAMGYYRTRGVTVVLSIPTIDTVEKMFPPDLMASAMDDPAVLARFASLLDEVLAVSQAELSHLVIGNEVNIYLGARPQSEWDSYAAFIAAGVAHVNASRPSIDVGISVSFGGLSDPRLTALTATTDVRYVTYYYIGNEFGGTPADNVADDFATMVAYAGDQPLVLKEYGYPSGPATGGSESGQADFIRETFAVWDAHADRVPFIMFSIMFDRDRETYCVPTAAYYGFPGDESFIQFLCTLGLRTYDDQPKPAWTELAAQAAARGF